MSVRIITHLGATILAGAGVWYFQAARLGADLAAERVQASQYREQIATERISAGHRLLSLERKINDNYQEALNAARDREALVRRELDQLRTVSDVLRDQSVEGARRFAAAPSAAVLEYATALGVVFDDCRAAYADMAAKASGHAADVQTLGAAWPVILNLRSEWREDLLPDEFKKRSDIAAQAEP